MGSSREQFVRSCDGTKNASHLILLFVRHSRRTILGCIGTVIDATSDSLTIKSRGREEPIVIDLRCLTFDADDRWWPGHRKWGLYDQDGNGWDFIDNEFAPAIPLPNFLPATQS